MGRTLRIITVVGARPQFIKAAAVTRAIRAHNETNSDVKIEESLLHTGQHYDKAMSAAFFAEFDLPAPSFNLHAGSGSHAEQTGRILMRVEPALLEAKPHIVLVYGDTNSTLAAALAAAKLGLPVAHVEAGLRAGRPQMAEEINRMITDRLSTYLFCPSAAAVQNLAREGISDGVVNVGDIMFDIVHLSMSQAETSRTLDRYGIRARSYALATVHREENADHPARLNAIMTALSDLADGGLPVLLPLHPRTKQSLDPRAIGPSIRMLPPLSHRATMHLTAGARVVLTDSGGLQKEAYWLGVPCVTLRDETEWTETVDAGWNVVASFDQDRIVAAARAPMPTTPRPDFYGSGDAAAKIVRHLVAAHPHTPLG